MNLAEIEQSLHEAIDSGDPDTLDYYAEHVAESMNPLVEALCLSIINTGFHAWASVMVRIEQQSPGLAIVLTGIERHIDRQRAGFIEARARNIADAAEHDAQMLAELNAELNRGGM